MREILFRGKRTDDYEWIEGSLCTTIPSDEDFYTISYFDFEGYYIEEKVIPETVGQYTGLTDKNGKKIFEGDILTAHFVSNRYKQQFEVIFEKGIFFFDNKCVKVPVWDIYSLNVIGNIHDNPELLKEGDTK